MRDTVTCDVLRAFNAILYNRLKIKLHINFIFDIRVKLRDYIIMYSTSNLCWEKMFNN